MPLPRGRERDSRSCATHIGTRVARWPEGVRGGANAARSSAFRRNRTPSVRRCAAVHWCATALLLVAVPLSARAADEPGEGSAFVEVAADRDVYFVHEPIRLRLRVGVDREHLRENFVPMFRRQLDLPAQVVAPWWDGLPNAALLPRERDDAGPQRTLAVNDGIVRADDVGDETRDGRAFAVVAVERTCDPSTAGDLVVTAPQLRFAFATRFEEDLFSGRTPLDPREAVVQGAPLTLRVRALPDEGRPANFSGGVGRFALAAETSARDVVVGQAFPLTLRITGDGNLETLDPPRLDDLDGFHVYGRIERIDVDGSGAATRTFAYDLAALRDDVRDVPPIEFAYFDTTPPAQYRVAHTAAIPLAVRPATTPAAAAPAARSASDVQDMRDHPILLLPVVIALISGLAGLLILVAALRRRRRAQPPQDPATLRARTAAEALRNATEAELAAAFTEVLAARLDCAPAAVISADLAARLVAAGVTPEHAKRAASVLETLVAARYGGTAPGEATRAAALQVLDSL